MSKLFKKLPTGEKKTIRYEIRLSMKEDEEIRTSALIRNLSVAEFMRRAAQGRRADISIDTEIILCLRNVVQSVRQLHAAYAAQGISIPREELGMLIDEALAAMLRICK
jgi:uncharacterized protein (DUF1778 family)